METEQLMGRYFRLRRELAQAYTQRPWHSGRIDRLAAELAAVEVQIAEQTAARDEPRHRRVNA